METKQKDAVLPGQNPSDDVSVQPGTEKTGRLWKDDVPSRERVLEWADGCVVLAAGVNRALVGGENTAVSHGAQSAVLWGEAGECLVSLSLCREVLGLSLRHVYEDGRNTFVLGEQERIGAGANGSPLDVYVPLKKAASLAGKQVWTDTNGRGLVLLGNSLPDVEEARDVLLLNGLLKELVFALPSEEAICASLRRTGEEPRLLLDGRRLEDVRKLVRTDAYAKEMLAFAEKKAEELLRAPSTGKDSDTLNRLKDAKHLAFVYLVTEKQCYFDEAWRRLEDGLKLPHWNPNIFLDASGAMESAALCYDWLYPQLSAEQRAALEDGLLNKGLLPSKYMIDHDVWWYYRVPYYNNWTAHCLSGVTLAALALGARRETELAADLIRRSLVGVADSFLFGVLPDGGWEEGHWYWGFGLTPLTMMLAGLECVLGSSFGLSDFPLMQKALYFFTHLSGPVGSFNFADSIEMGKSRAVFLWWAGRLGDPNLGGVRLREIMGNRDKQNVHRFFIPSMEDLLFYDPRSCNFDVLRSMDRWIPCDALYRNVETVTLRTSWDDPDAVFAAVKGGRGEVNHGHADVGTFVLEANGERWAWELASDHYELPRYFDTFGNRYSYYRCMPTGHNTLVFGSREKNCQNIFREARVTEAELGGDRSRASVDMTPVYEEFVRKAVRTLELDKRARVVCVSDEIETKYPQEVLWQLHTKAEIELASPKEAILRQNGKTLRAVLDGEGAWEVGDAMPPEGSLFREQQSKNEEFRRLYFVCRDVEKAGWQVRFYA